MAHFGNWLKKLRLRLGGMSQQEFADALGLRSYMSVRLRERDPENHLSDRALDALMNLCRVQSVEELDRLWKNDLMPEIPELKDTPGIVAEIIKRSGRPHSPVAFPPTFDELIAQIARAQGMTHEALMSKYIREGLERDGVQMKDPAPSTAQSPSKNLSPAERLARTKHGTKDRPSAGQKRKGA